MRYVILDPQHGIFLGTHTSKAFDPSGSILSLWSRYNVFALTRAYSFDTKHEASMYLDHYLYEDFPDCFVATVNTDEKYIDVVDLLKCGLGSFTYDMMDGLPMQNQSIH
jgi:hypothetical protein